MLFKDNFRKILDRALVGFKFKHTEKIKPLHGEYWMILKENGRVVDERHGTNIIVNTASILVARLLKDSKEPDGGITYLAVGTGAQGWNLQNPPQPTNTQTTLYGEISRKAFTTEDVTFIEPDTGDPTTAATNVIDFTATFAETEAVGPLVEMGLFGGDATDISGSGSQINYRTFPVINKTNSMTLTIIFRMTA